MRLLERGADFREFLAQAGAEAAQDRHEGDGDQRRDQRVFDGGGAGLVANKRLESSQHDVAPFVFWTRKTC